VTGILPTANGGTGIAYFTAAGPTVARVYTFPDAAATILYSGGALGTPSSGTLTNATGLPITGIVDSITEALGVGSLELGHASDTTIERSAAGKIKVEGEVLSGAEVFSFAVNAPADTMEPFLLKAREAFTITDIHCITEAATSAVIDVQECSGTGTGCATVDAAITCDADGAEDDGTLSNGTIDAGDWVKVDVGTVTGTVESVTVTVYYDFD
jgi:hypothetical protein